MSGVIAASRVVGGSFIVNAEGISRFQVSTKFLGSLSINKGNGGFLPIYSTDQDNQINEGYNYQQPFTGQVKVSGNLNMIVQLNFDIGLTGGVLKFNTTELGKLKNVKAVGSTSESIYVTGDIADLPRKVTEVYFLTGYFSGKLLNVPPLTKMFVISRDNALTGDIADLPNAVENFGITGSTGISGTIARMPASLKVFAINTESFSFTGNLSELKPNITNFNIGGSNHYITGDLASLSNNIKNIFLNCPTNITGSLSTLPVNMVELSLYYNNTISGNIADLPDTLTVMGLQGANTVTGNIATLKSAILAFQVGGSNTVTGDISAFPSGLLFLSILGSNTVYGNVSGLSRNMQSFTVEGLNSITGDVADIPQSLYQIVLRGNNTLFGNLANLNRMQVIRLTGNMSCTYTTAVWGSIAEFTYVPTTNGLTTAQVNQLLIDLSAAQWFAYNLIDLRGANAARSSASNGAITLLQSKGVTILTN